MLRHFSPPPPDVVDELNRLASPEGAGTSAAATVTPVGVPGGMSIGQVVGRMFGGYGTCQRVFGAPPMTQTRGHVGKKTRRVRVVTRQAFLPHANSFGEPAWPESPDFAISAMHRTLATPCVLTPQTRRMARPSACR